MNDIISTNRLLLISTLLLVFATTISADSDNDGRVVFPVWTYYAEIVEHSLMAVIAIVVIVQIADYKKPKNAVKYGLAGFAVFFLAEILTIMHHYLIYIFGIYTAIIHHGLLLVSIALISYAFVSSLKKK